MFTLCSATLNYSEAVKIQIDSFFWMKVWKTFEEELKMNRWLISVLTLTLMGLGLTPALAQDNNWPRTVPLENGTVTIYAPQLDKMTGNTIHYRAAIAYREKAGAEPVFGAGWFESPVDIDKVTRIVHPVDFLSLIHI